MGPKVIEDGFRGVATRNQLRPHVLRARLRVDAGRRSSLGRADRRWRPTLMPFDPPGDAFAVTRVNQPAG